MSMIKEAEVILEIAKALEPFPDRQKAAILSAACSMLGQYEYAEKFANDVNVVCRHSRPYLDCPACQSECKRIAGILAKLSAKGPAFLNPLEAMAAEKIRDEILSRMGLNPDGTLKASAK